ncbi:small auxin-up RNA [Tanacetum coccineum]
MGVFRLQSIVSNAKQLIKLNNKNQRDIPKGYLAVYVGEVQKKRFVVPLSYLDQPLFQDLLRRSEDEFGFNHPMGGLTILCREEAFVHLSNQLHVSLRPTVCLRGHTDLRNRRNETNGNSDAGRFFVQTKGSAVQMGTRAVNREDNKD